MSPKAKTKAKPRPRSENRDACDPAPALTEAELFADLPEDVDAAWKKLRAFVKKLGPDQSAHTSNRSIMFKREQLFAFVTPKKTAFELYIILPRVIESELIRNFQSTKTRTCHLLKINHVDQVDEPITDWLREAFEAN